jgi:hypothetical protein
MEGNMSFPVAFLSAISAIETVLISGMFSESAKIEKALFVRRFGSRAAKIRTDVSMSTLT